MKKKTEQNHPNLGVSLLWRLRDICGAHPWLYFRILGWRKTIQQFGVSHATELVIDGFPRSANSYSVRAFHHFNPTVKVAHHLHVAAQIIEGVRRGIPTCLLLREPEEAAASLVLYNQIGPKSALRYYLHFHERIETLREGFVVARFATVTDAFESVITAINQRFDTAFHAGSIGPELKEHLFNRMETVALSKSDDQGKISRPLSNRKAQKEKIVQTLPAELLKDCRAVYERLT